MKSFIGWVCSLRFINEDDCNDEGATDPEVPVDGVTHNGEIVTHNGEIVTHGGE